MEGKQTPSLKDRLNISNYICRGKSREVIDLVYSYYLTKQNLEQQLYKNNEARLAESGYSPEMIKLGLLISELETLSDMEVVEYEFDLPMSDEWLELKAKRDDLTKMLSNNPALPPEKREEVEQNLSEIEKGLAAEKKDKLSKYAEVQYAKEMANMKPKPVSVNVIALDPENKLMAMENDIIRKFLVGKINVVSGQRYTEEVVEQIVAGDHELSFSKKDVTELCWEICREPQNDVDQSANDFFTNMMS